MVIYALKIKKLTFFLFLERIPNMYTKLFKVIPDFSSFCLEGKKELPSYSIIKGAVQSGKSAIIHALALFLCMEHQHNVVILLRNFTDDFHQMFKGLSLFLESIPIATRPRIHYTGNMSRNKKDGSLKNHENFCMDIPHQKSIILSLAHYEHLHKLNECLEISKYNGPLTVIIDEVDQLLYSESIFSNYLEKLLENSWNVVGISATIFELFHELRQRFSSAQTFVLQPPNDYKGILNIKFHDLHKIDTKIKKKNPEDIFKWDTSLYSFLKKNCHVEPFGNHPMITLIKTERLIKNQGILLNKIASHKKLELSYTVLTYNGSRITMYSKNLVGKKIPNAKSEGQEHVFRNASIQQVLQFLKDNGGSVLFPRILIISHGLVGRGINIVSDDFQWHLTHMFYRPHSSSNIATLLQSIRLCGIYKDDIPLTCYVENNVYKNIYRGYQLQEDIFQRLQVSDQSKPLSDWLQTEIFYKEKVPTKKCCKNTVFGGVITSDPKEDTGMSMDVFNQDFGIESVEEIDTNFKIDCKKLSKWVESNNLLGKMLRYLYDNPQGVSIANFKTGVEYQKDNKSWMSNICNGAPGGKYPKDLGYPRLWYKFKDTQRIILDSKIRKAMEI